MKALEHLKSFEDFTMKYENLNHSSKEKVKSTIKYTLSKNPIQNKKHVAKRCLIATLAEQKVAEHMNGRVMDSEVDFDDPYSFAFDVLSSHEYHGARIEVKTHQSDSKWINVNLDLENKSNFMNLYPFLNYGVADFIIIFRSHEPSKGLYMFEPCFIGTQADITSVINKSMYNDQFYLDI